MFRLIFPVLLASSLVLPSVAAAQSLRGSRASVDLMHRQATRHELHFYETSDGVRKAANRGDLVRLRTGANFKLGDVSHPYVLPATETFLNRLGAQYRSACGETMVVTSAVRPKSLRLVNSTDKSVHPTGMAVDLRKPTRARCLSWLRNTLSALDAAGVIEAIEEHRPPHFHIAVFPTQYQRYVSGQGGKPVQVADAGTAASKAEREAPRAAPAADQERRYRVRRGDSLWTIARKNNVSVDRLKKANALRSSRIVAGQTLLIPTR